MPSQNSLSNAYTVIHSFTGQSSQFSDGGDEPHGSLVADGSTLYGMTYKGGANNKGVIFKLTPPSDPSGGDPYTYEAMYSFGSDQPANCPADGCFPRHGSMTLHAGTLYGAAISGGVPTVNFAGGGGVLFSVSTTKTGASSNPYGYQVIHAFSGATQKPESAASSSKPDGDQPHSGPYLAPDGKLYGMTQLGGDDDVGTVYSIEAGSNTSGYEVVFSFKSESGATGNKTGPGNKPHGAPIVLENGCIYGMTRSGGDLQLSYQSGSAGGTALGGGTVFAYDPKSGEAQRDVYVFKDDKHSGAQPLHGNMIEVGGLLYAMTHNGGEHSHASSGADPRLIKGHGVVFSYDPTADASANAHELIYAFGSQAGDGEHPLGSLVASIDGKTLYGLTGHGGKGNGGTAFSVAASGGETSEATLYDFATKSEGVNPGDSVILVDGMLIGMTRSGGAHGKGVVFTLDPESGD